MSRLPSTSNHSFAQVPNAEIQRSTFNRSHGHKTTIFGDFITPIYVDEALPGDTFNMKMSIFSRLTTPIKPIMDNIKMDVHFFAIPMRLVWNNFQKFMGEQIDPGDSTDYLIPTITSGAGGFINGSLQDYMGVPTLVSNLEISALFHRAYILTYNEWYRDQNLQDSLVLSKGDGPDLFTDNQNKTLQRRNKKHDYFTSALPWPQKGDSVQIPISGSANILRDSAATAWKAYRSATDTLNTSMTGFYTDASGFLIADGAVDYGSSFDPNGGLSADLASATNATINELRQAFQIQRLLERDARGGSRYTEIIKAHFGVTSPDARLQRPEFLGGFSTDVNIHPIAQTSETGTSPQGNLAGMATASATGQGFVKSFTEHSIILGLASCRPDLTYQQGLNKMFTRSTKYDFYWPALSHLGEQAVLNKEIYAQGTTADEDVFGYQERYAEYRYKPSIVTNQFRSNHTQTLDIWHMAQDFASLPLLNSSFIQYNSPYDRVLAVTNESNYLTDMYFDLKCTRPMPVYSVPGLVDHL